MTRSDERREAADWFAKQKRAVMSVEERGDFDAWRQNPRNLAALNAMHELWGEMAALKGAEPALEARPLRRRVLGGAAVAASIALGGLAAFATFQPLAFAQTEQTAIGEQRARTLPDGSVASLNVVTRIDYRMHGDRRDVRLREGQALFVVRDDKNRPFLVHSGDYEIRAAGGGAFDVRLRDGAAEVSVQDGAVQVIPTRGKDAGHVIATLAAGRRLRLAADALDATPPKTEIVSPQSVAEWRLRTVTYRDVTVAEAVEDLNRFFPRAIEVADPALAGRRVTLRLQAADREEVLRTLSALLGAQVERRERADVLTVSAS